MNRVPFHLLAACAAVLLVGVGCDNRVEMTVKGTAINFNRWWNMRIYEQKPASEALAASLMNGSVSWTTLDETTKSTPTAADGKFEFKLKAEPKKTFQLYLEGGKDTGGLEIVPMRFIKEYTVPDKDGVVDTGIAEGTQLKGDIHEMIATAVGQTNDELVKQGSIMLGGLTKYSFPDSWVATDAPFTVSVDNGFTSVDCCGGPGGVSNISTEFTAGSGFVTKKGMTTETEVTITLTDKGTGAGHPYTWKPIKLKVKPGYSTNVWAIAGQ